MPLALTLQRQRRPRTRNPRTRNARTRNALTRNPRTARKRTGRALIELIVSALLLSVAATATLSLLQLTVAASVRISDLSSARDLARNLAEQTAASPCNAAAGAASQPRIAANWSPSMAQQSVNVALTVNFVPRPGAVSTPRALDAVLAGWCS